MADFRRDNNLTQDDACGGRDGPSSAMLGSAPRAPQRRVGPGGPFVRATATGFAAASLLVGLAVPASASGNPNPWAGAQVGVQYPVYQPHTVLALPRSSFRLLSCGPGQDESVFATYGTAYTPLSNFGKTVGFSMAEGYPYICANPGEAKQVGVWKVGIPYGTVSVRVSVYCDPAQFKSCTTASGLKSGYVLEWAQPYGSNAFLKKRTQMFMDTSRLTLAQALHVVAGVRPVM